MESQSSASAVGREFDSEPFTHRDVQVGVLEFSVASDTEKCAISNKSPVVMAVSAFAPPVGPSVDVERAAFDPHGRFGRNIGTIVAVHIVGVIVGEVWRGDLVSDSGLEHSVGIVALDFVIVSRFRFNTPWLGNGAIVGTVMSQV